MATVAAAGQQPYEHGAPQHRRHRVLHRGRHPSDRRPERLDEGGDEQHHQHADAQQRAAAPAFDQGIDAPPLSRRDQVEAQAQSRATGYYYRGQLERRMAADEAPERITMADRLQVAGYGAGTDAFVRQRQDRTEPDQHSAGEYLEADADVVPDVEAEHRHVGAVVATERALRVVRVVHVLETGELYRVVQRAREIGLDLDRGVHRHQRQHEQQHRRQHHALLRAHQA